MAGARQTSVLRHKSYNVWSSKNKAKVVAAQKSQQEQTLRKEEVRLSVAAALSRIHQDESPTDLKKDEERVSFMYDQAPEEVPESIFEELKKDNTDIKEQTQISDFNITEVSTKPNNNASKRIHHSVAELFA